MSDQSQYQKMINTMCAEAYQRIDSNYVDSLDALGIPHIFGNLIADLPQGAHQELIKCVIKCSIRDLKQYGLTRIYLISHNAKAPTHEDSKYDFFIVTQQTLPNSLTSNNQLLNEWLKQKRDFNMKVKLMFIDEGSYLIRKDSCQNGHCEIALKTGTRCEDNNCLCLPFLAEHQGFQLLFIEPNQK